MARSESRYGQLHCTLGGARENTPRAKAKHKAKESKALSISTRWCAMHADTTTAAAAGVVVGWW